MDQLKDTIFKETLTMGNYVVYNIPPSGNLPACCTPVNDAERAWRVTLGSFNPYVVVDQNTKTIALLFDKIRGDLTERAVYTTLIIIRAYLLHWKLKPEIARARPHCAYIICDGDSNITSTDIKETLAQIRKIIL